MQWYSCWPQSLILLQTGPVVEQAVKALILVPTKELARQAQFMIQQLAAYCARDVRVANVSAAEDTASQRWVKAVREQNYRDLRLGLCVVRDGAGPECNSSC